VHTLRTVDPAGRGPALAPTVALVSRDELLVLRIRDALDRDGIELVGHATDIPGLSDDADSSSAIVLVGGSAVGQRRTLIRAAATRFPGIPLVVVASLTTTGVHKALDAGAAGLVLDSGIESGLAATIRAVDAGQVVVPGRFRRNAVRPALSHREKQTLSLVAAGLTNRQIAAELFLAESTVKTHLTSVFGKLGVASRSEAAALVLDPDQKLGCTVPGFSPAGGDGHANGNGTLVP
jgi:DNA-binding NarL/FixJ family response regulator